MPPVADRIIEMLSRKSEIDMQNQTSLNMVSYERWLVDAVQLLLELEFQRANKTKNL